MARRKDRNNVLGKVKYITVPALDIHNTIKNNFAMPDHKAWDKMAGLAEIGLEVEKSGVDVFFIPFKKRRRK